MDLELTVLFRLKLFVSEYSKNTPSSHLIVLFSSTRDDRTLFIRFGSPRPLEAVSQVELTVGGDAVTTSYTTWDLGVTLDAQLLC